MVSVFRCAPDVSPYPWCRLGKCVFQATLAQRLCGGGDQGSINQLSLYTSPSLPNITLGLPATATATAASNVRRKSAGHLTLHPWMCLFCSLASVFFSPLSSRWLPLRMQACNQPSPSAPPFCPVAIWAPTLQIAGPAATALTAPCCSTWFWWSRVPLRARWWQVRPSQKVWKTWNVFQVFQTWETH